MNSNISKVISKLTPSIELHAEQASKTFSVIDYKHEIFEGTGIALTKEMCKEIYTELLTHIIENQLIVYQKYGLLVMAIPIKKKGKNKKKNVINIQFGVIFPGDI